MGVRKRTCVRVLATYLGAVAVGVGAVAVTMSGWIAATAVGLAFVGAAVVGIVAFARFVDYLYAEQERHRQALFAADLSTLTRLREASQIREDLIASVSHEFRTPLTAIRGSAATLVQRYEQLDRDAQEDLLVGILESSDRLSRLLEDMLIAASASVGDAGAVADVSSAVNRFNPSPPKFSIQMDVDPHLGAFIDSESLYRVVTALGEHVRDAARRDRPVCVDARRSTDQVLVGVSYAPADDKEDLEALLDPFAGGASNPTGRPASLALYVVRRLVEAHGGDVSIGPRGDQRSIQLSLRALGHRTSPERGLVEAAPRTSPENQPANRPQ
jgi:K+-sensing histidine kinase KdpD